MFFLFFIKSYLSVIPHRNDAFRKRYRFSVLGVFQRIRRFEMNFFVILFYPEFFHGERGGTHKNRLWHINRKRHFPVFLRQRFFGKTSQVVFVVLYGVGEPQNTLLGLRKPLFYKRQNFKPDEITRVIGHKIRFIDHVIEFTLFYVSVYLFSPDAENGADYSSVRRDVVYSDDPERRRTAK